MAISQIIAQPQLAPSPFVAVEEYLRSTYHPDRDYVDGQLKERNLGEWEHARLQAVLTSIFYQNEEAWGIRVAPEARLQINATRFRVPDVMIVKANHLINRIVRSAPLLCIELLSPGDSWRQMEVRLQDYVDMGVQNIWAFDPASREIFVCVNGVRRWVNEPELLVADTDIRVSVEKVFAALPNSK